MTVQDQLQEAIFRFTRTRISTMCAGRTDAGVHASEQVVHLDTELDRLPVSWVRGVNAYLPSSIAVRWACEVPGGKDGFHLRCGNPKITAEFHAGVARLGSGL